MSRIFPAQYPGQAIQTLGTRTNLPWVPRDSAGGVGDTTGGGDPSLYALSGWSATISYLSSANVGYAGAGNALTFVMFFAQPSTPSGTQVPFAVRDFGTYTSGYNMQYVAGHQSAARVGAFISNVADGGVVNGTVNMIAGTIGSGTNILQYWRNGNAVGSAVGGASPFTPGNASRKVSIGTDTDGASYPSSLQIIAVGISSTTLSAGQMSALWTNFQQQRDLTAAIFPGAQNIWSVKANGKTAPASWVDIVGGVTLTKAGAPALVTIQSPTFGT